MASQNKNNEREGNVEFATWLASEVKRRDWSFDILDRKAGLSVGTTDEVMSGTATPGWEFCLKVSWALDEPPERLFDLAGLLPSFPSAIREEMEAISLLRNLQPDVRLAIMDILRALTA
jgi:hypothetical protein